MKIKDEIRVTYLITLDTDRIQDDLHDGYNLKDVMEELKLYGHKSKYTCDYSVEEVENVGC